LFTAAWTVANVVVLLAPLVTTVMSRDGPSSKLRGGATNRSGRGANNTTTFATVQAAVNKAAAASDGNDTINVNPGTYTGSVVISNSAKLTTC